LREKAIAAQRQSGEGMRGRIFKTSGIIPLSAGVGRRPNAICEKSNFRPRNDKLEIVRILHQRMDVERHL
jgi:plasmid stabilization system protein ParE